MMHIKKCRKCSRFIKAKNDYFCSLSCNRSWHNSNKAVAKKAFRSTKKNTVYTQKSELDQFYTNENISKECYEDVLNLYNQKDFDIFLEPSAGTGSFFKLFPKNKRVGLDLDPKDDDIVKKDFFTYTPPEGIGPIITIGNPPFGRICSIAVKFFNAAAEFSDVIAFIIPKTFQKKSLQNKLHLNFHLKLNKNLPKNSFVYNNLPYDVPCCFQIWERSDNKRRIQKTNLNNKTFEFVDKDNADIAVRRVGGRAGKATKDIKDLSITSHYFLKFKSNNNSSKFIDSINDIDFSKITNATAGVKSISKPEFVDKLLKLKIIEESDE